MNAQDARFPLLPIRGGIVLPEQVAAFPVGRVRSRALLDDLKDGDKILIAAQRDPKVDAPNRADLVDIATLATVRGVRRSGRFPQLLVEGEKRVALGELEKTEPWLLARAEDASETAGDESRARVAVDAARIFMDELIGQAEGDLKRALRDLRTEPDPGRIADRLAVFLGVPAHLAISLAMNLDKAARLEQLLNAIDKMELESELKKSVEKKVRQDLGESQREAILRARMKAIQDELGEGGDSDELREKLAAKDLPGEVRKVVDKEFAKLGRGSGPEQGVVRTYLEWIADVPWSESTDEARATLAEVATHLDENHRGLDEVKERILEHLAVRQRTPASKDITILCLAGPPGTGKTSLGQSVADALGRPLVRVALGGVRDEAEIRGHRRTYVGARPGRIIHALKKAEVRNPVFLLDEIDKLGRGWAGDPEAALLEVLDPEQNQSFTDHYMELPFDLSDVLFICTANDLSQLSAPLLDRLEIINLDGYVTDEKRAIAREHLLPKALKRVGLEDTELLLDDDQLSSIIEGWTREAGVRQLTRALEKIARSTLLKLMRESEMIPQRVHVTDEDIDKALGKQRFFPEVKERTSLPGIATGLAWTPVGGDVLFIETSRSRGKGRVEVTGKLGEVMSESARAALSWVRAHADDLGFDASELEETDLHIHVPQGAVPKDGPSAGVTLVTALSSLMSGKRVRADTAMTGEVTLRGRVLPVGGIKAKVLAAHRAGIERVILPERNARDLDEVPERVRDALEFVFVREVSEVLEAALETTASAHFDDDSFEPAVM